MRIAIISHTYLEEQNQKNIDALARYAEVQAYTPKEGPVTVFKRQRFGANRSNSPHVLALNTVRPFGSQYYMRGLSTALKAFQPDVINLEYSPWELMALQADIFRICHRSTAALICTVKKNTYAIPKNLRGLAKRSLLPLARARCDRVLAVSQLAASLYVDDLGFSRDSVRVIQQLGIDHTAFAPVPRKIREKIRVGYVGPVSRHKGIAVLVEAMKLVLEKGIPVELSVLGTGDYDADLAMLARAEPWLNITPPKPLAAVPAFLATLDIFACPSLILPDHQEHDGQAVREAMACGLPCIATRSGVFPDLLDYSCGILVHPGDKQTLSDAIAHLANSPSRRIDLGSAARKRAVARWTLDEVAKAKLRAFEEIVDDSKR